MDSFDRRPTTLTAKARGCIFVRMPSLRRRSPPRGAYLSYEDSPSRPESGTLLIHRARRKPVPVSLHGLEHRLLSYMHQCNFAQGNQNVRSNAEIVAALFFKRPPQNPIGRVRNLVNRVRIKIEDKGRDPALRNLIVTEEDGYRLLTSPAQPGQSSSAPAGRILSPRGGPVSRHFTVNGTLIDIPRGRVVWLAIGVDGMLWPKAEIARSESSWTRELDESGDPSKRFGLALLMVGPFRNRKIKSWLARGAQKDHFAGFPSEAFSGLRGRQLLDETRDLVLRD